MYICIRRKNQDISNNTTARCCNKTGWEHFECGVVVICGYICNAYMWVPACVETSGLPWVFFNAIPLTDRLFLRQGLPLGLESDDRLSWLTRQAPRVPPVYAFPGVEIRACCTMPRNFQMHSGAVLRLPCLYQSTLPTEGCFLLYFCLRIYIETGYSYMTQAN